MECSIGVMEDDGSILSVIEELDFLEDVEDVDMLDVEEGELVEGQTSLAEVNPSMNEVNTSTFVSKNRKRRNNKKKNKKKKSMPGSNVTDVNKLVLNVCRRLKEKKSYLVYTAVGCLGVSAFCDLVKEVDAINACGGQQTADGKRFRTGGGILWNILKTREPNAYREIMKKGKEFEKQFTQTINVEPLMKHKDANQMAPSKSLMKFNDGNQTGPFIADKEVEENPTQKQNEHDQAKPKEKRVSAHGRMRVPVSYDDLLGDDADAEVPTSA